VHQCCFLSSNLVVGSVPPEKAGAACGLATTANDLGTSLGVVVIAAVTAIIAATCLHHVHPTGKAQQVEEIIS